VVWHPQPAMGGTAARGPARQDGQARLDPRGAGWGGFESRGTDRHQLERRPPSEIPGWWGLVLCPEPASSRRHSAHAGIIYQLGSSDQSIVNCWEFMMVRLRTGRHDAGGDPPRRHGIKPCLSTQSSYTLYKLPVVQETRRTRSFRTKCGLNTTCVAVLEPLCLLSLASLRECGPGVLDPAAGGGRRSPRRRGRYYLSCAENTDGRYSCVIAESSTRRPSSSHQARSDCSTPLRSGILTDAYGDGQWNRRSDWAAS